MNFYLRDDLRMKFIVYEGEMMQEGASTYRISSSLTQKQ